MSEISRARRDRESLMMAATTNSTANSTSRVAARRKSAVVARSVKRLKSAVKAAAAAGNLSPRQPCRAARAGALPNLQTWLGGDRGENAQRAGHAVCLPVLHGFTSSSGAGARIPQDAARALGEAAPGANVEE